MKTVLVLIPENDAAVTLLENIADVLGADDQGTVDLRKRHS